MSRPWGYTTINKKWEWSLEGSPGAAVDQDPREAAPRCRYNLRILPFCRRKVQPVPSKAFLFFFYYPITQVVFGLVGFQRFYERSSVPRLIWCISQCGAWVRLCGGGLTSMSSTPLLISAFSRLLICFKLSLYFSHHNLPTEHKICREVKNTMRGCFPTRAGGSHRGTLDFPLYPYFQTKNTRLVYLQEDSHTVHTVGLIKL